MFEISVLEKNYKQSDPEGRASFMKAMAREIAAISAGTGAKHLY